MSHVIVVPDVLPMFVFDVPVKFRFIVPPLTVIPPNADTFPAAVTVKFVPLI